jgi:ribulose kinase
MVLVENLALPGNGAGCLRRRIFVVELADWIPSVLAGVAKPEKIVRGICAAGHKALYSDEWSGLPDKRFLAALDPRLAGC